MSTSQEDQPCSRVCRNVNVKRVAVISDVSDSEAICHFVCPQISQLLFNISSMNYKPITQLGKVPSHLNPNLYRGLSQVYIIQRMILDLRAVFVWVVITSCSVAFLCISCIATSQWDTLT